jgi:hypothetical protein
LKGKQKTRKFDGFNLMIEVTSDWQTVDLSLAELENSWSVFDNDDKKFGQSLAMLANSWAVL